MDSGRAIGQLGQRTRNRVRPEHGVRELKALQSNRAVNDVWAEATGREFIPLVDVAKVTKQTQKSRVEDLYDDLFDVYVRREKEFLAGAMALDNQRLAAEEAVATETAA